MKGLALVTGTPMILALARTAPAAEGGETGPVSVGAKIGTIGGKIDFNAVTPCLGLGCGPNMEKRWGFTFDTGVLFPGVPQVDLTASGPIAQDPGFLVELAEEEKAIEDGLGSFSTTRLLRWVSTTASRLRGTLPAAGGFR